jgi:hypothetical protein
MITIKELKEQEREAYISGQLDKAMLLSELIEMRLELQEKDEFDYENE